jgi:uncharacterized membrane protein
MSKEAERRERFFIAQIVISLVVLLGAFYVIFFSSAPNAAKWAIGIAGLVVGYWLREALIILIIIFIVIIFIVII